MTNVMEGQLPLDLLRTMKSLKKFSKKLIKDLVDRLHYFSSYQEEETLHEIRVHVKKIKAVINLVGYCQKKFNSHKAFIPFRNIFRKAGGIREPEVLRRLLTNYPAQKKNSKAIVDRGLAVEAFLEDIPYFVDRISGQWKKLKPRVANIRRKDFDHYVRSKEREIDSKLSPKPIMKDIHKTRKAIKAMLYLSKVKDDLPESTKTFYAEMEETIGQLHDKQVLLENLKKLNGQAGKARVGKLTSGCAQDKKKIEKMAKAFYAGSTINIKIKKQENGHPTKNQRNPLAGNLPETARGQARTR
jgi:CHAD domain-containing protein